jgi:beta-glucosidase-like glycosyl hydrolase
MNPARLVFPGLRWGDRGPAEIWPEVREALDLGVGGFCVFGGSVTGMREIVARALDHASRPLLFASDLERGAGQQLREATPLPPVAALAGLGDTELLEAARITAQEATAAGIAWVLAPVADLDLEPLNPIIGTRSFGDSPSHVSDLVRAWVISAQAEGVIACVKHFPGHGRTTVDSHAELPVVAASREELESDLTPFRAAIEAGVGSVMLAHVRYPALDPAGAPASLSAKIISYLREGLGFDGLVATDALVMEAIAAAGRSEGDAAVESVRAGCDVVLYPHSPHDTVHALTKALDSRTLDPQRVAEAGYRIIAAAASTRMEEEHLRPIASHAQALEMATASIRLIRGSWARYGSGEALRLHVVDDDEIALPSFIGAPGHALADRGHLGESLRKRDVSVADASAEEAKKDLVALFSEVKGWKGRSNLAERSIQSVHDALAKAPGAVVVLFGHPRLAEQLPFADNVICAWCGDELMQDAVAERLVAAAS